ncbi:MAG TPA: hypothetical protein VH641_13320 [Streptosporangiaceae bacterium]|jgi:hypothetical protein
MPAAAPHLPERLPRRARYLIPLSAPRRAEVLAAAALAALLAGVLFAQLTLIAAIAFHAFGKLSRLRPSWLLVPAACGLVAVLGVGLPRSLAGYWAVPSGAGHLLAGAVNHPTTAARLSGIPGIIGREASRQLPVALLLATGIAAAACWLRWLHTDEWDLPRYRAGLVSRCRHGWTVWFVRSGTVVTADGACLGADLDSGRPVTVSWDEAAGGVLVTGADPPAVAASGFQLVHAAIRRRKPVLVVDLAGDRHLPAALSAVCAAAGAPLLRFGHGPTARYEPFRDPEPARVAGLAMGIIDWRGVPQPAARACRDCLTTGFALLDAAPGEPDVAALDELAGLLTPGALRARAARVPAWHPGRESLAGRAELAEQWLARDPATAGLIVSQLTALRESGPGRLLSPGPGPQISVDAVMRDRAVALFSLGDNPSAAGAMIANLLALDITSRYAAAHQSGTAPDGLVWLSHCDRADPTVLAQLAAAAPGLVPVLTTTSPAVAGALAGQVSVCVAHRLTGPELAVQLAAMTGTRLVPAAGFGPGPQPVPPALVPVAAQLSTSTWPDGGASHGRPGYGAAPVAPAPFGTIRSSVIPAETLCRLGNGEFVLIAGAGADARGTQPRVVVPRARVVSGRIPRVAPPREPGHAPPPVWSR